MGQADEQGTMDQGSTNRAKRLWRKHDGSPRMRAVVVAAGLVAVVSAPVGIAATGDALREGARNGTTVKETEIISNIGSTTGTKGGYSTRQSNLSSSGGGAIYGCRSTAGASTSTPPRNPCIRANNLATGYAFEFSATNGDVAGTIIAGNGGDSKKPFTTNATGVATGLNADRVDGLDASAIAAAAAADAAGKVNAAKERFALVDASGTIIRQTGGFKTVNCYQANANCYIDAGEDVTNNQITSEIVTTNGAADAGTPMQLTGDISSSPCFYDFVACGPTGTDSTNGGNPGVFVVTPRNSDGSAVDLDGADNIAGNADDQKNYYFSITVSGSESQ